MGSSKGRKVNAKAACEEGRWKSRGLREGQLVDHRGQEKGDTPRHQQQSQMIHWTQIFNLLAKETGAEGAVQQACTPL